MSGKVEDPYEYTDADLDRFMSVAVKLAGEAGEMIAAATGKQQPAAVSQKTGERYCHEGTGSSVLTETDAAVEKHLVEGFSRVST